jgi:hypothetical protein
LEENNVLLNSLKNEINKISEDYTNKINQQNVLKNEIHQLQVTYQQKNISLTNFQNKILLIQYEIKKLENQTNGYKTLKDMIPDISNEYQKTILDKITSDVEYSKIYLSSYTSNDNPKKKDILGTVKVLGTYNEKKLCREEYEIKIYKESPKGTFWCNCADHKFNSTKKNSSCKHICFLVCKVLKLLKPAFFENKTLSPEEIKKLIDKLTSDTLWKDSTVAKEFEKITLDTYREFTKLIDDCCPICFNDLSDNDKPQLLSCPTCHNYTHKECAEVWLEQKECCMICKSNIWINYNKVKNGGYITKTMIL